MDNKKVAQLKAENKRLKQHLWRAIEERRKLVAMVGLLMDDVKETIDRDEAFLREIEDTEDTDLN